MSKISIDLLTVTGEYSAFSPVIWDGANVVMVESPQYNLKFIRDDLNTLAATLLQQPSLIQQKNVDSVQLNLVSTSQLTYLNHHE
jgi:hypothetical protein